MDGTTQERALLTVLRGHGFLGLRSPGSGTGDWEQPDVLAGQQSVIAATELKSGNPPTNPRQEEVAALQRFGNAFGAAVLVGARYSGDRTFYLAPPSKLDRTDAGNYSIPNSPERYPWTIALPYTESSGDADARWQPDRDVGTRGVIYNLPEAPPGLRDYIDALTTAQQGFQVRQGVVDAGRPRGRYDPDLLGSPGDPDNKDPGGENPG